MHPNIVHFTSMAFIIEELFPEARVYEENNSF
jgi:hypothetical protein